MVRTFFLFVFCYLSTIAFAQNSNTVKHPVEVGIDLSHYIYGELGAAGFAKIRMKEPYEGKKHQIQRNFRIFLGHFAKQSSDILEYSFDDFNGNRSLASRKNQFKNLSFLEMGVEKAYQRNKNTLFYGFDGGVFRKFESYNLVNESYQNGVLFFSNDNKITQYDFGGILAVFGGYKYAITESLGVGLEIGATIKTARSVFKSKDSLGNIGESMNTKIDMDPIFTRPRMLFLSWQF